MYTLLGEYDLALVIDFPGIKEAIKTSIDLVKLTGITFTTFPAMTVLEFDKMENRYEANTKEHINLICKGCKKIMDYPSPFMMDTLEILRKCRFQVTDSRVEYYGYCQKCSKTQTL
jgi:hypothetical protein